MSRIDFGRCFFENVEKLFLSMFLHVWARAFIRSSYLCVCRFVLTYTGLFLRFCMHGNGLTYAKSCLYTWALTHICEMLGRSPILPIFTYFSTVSLPHPILTHLFVIFAPDYHYILFLFFFIITSKNHIF